MIYTSDAQAYAKVVAQYGAIWTMMRLTLLTNEEDKMLG